MSTILKALKQAEKDSPDPGDENRPSFNVRAAINSRRQQQKQSDFLSLGRIFILVTLVIVTAISAYSLFFMNRHIPPQMPETVLKPQPAMPADAPETLPDDNAPLIVEEPALSLSEKEDPITEEKEPLDKITPRMETLPLENDSLRVQAISWSETPENRIAVIDNRVLKEGDSVQGYRLLIIEKDAVILHSSGGDYRLEFKYQ